VSEVAFQPFGLTPEQREIRDVCREFADREIRPIAAEVDEADTETPWEVWYKAAALGLTSFMLPEEYGGGGLTDCVTGVVVQEELCRGCAGIGNLITSGGFFAEPIVELGSEEQKRRWLEPIAGKRPPLTALATTEPGAGSDAASISTTATRTDGGYVLRGQKTWISNGGLGDYYVVFATVEPGSRSRGITAFAVPGDAPGLAGEPLELLAPHAIGRLELDGVAVGPDQVLGRVDQGFGLAMRTLDRFRPSVGAFAVGMAQAALDAAVAHAAARRAFGRPLREHQAALVVEEDELEVSEVLV